MAENFGVAIISVLTAAVVIFLATIAGALFGGISGWVVGLVFSDTFEKLRIYFGLSSLSMWQIGCGLGFAGAFFRTSVSKS